MLSDMARAAARTVLAKRITSRGRRLTKQRVIVAQALAAERQATSAQELHQPTIVEACRDKQFHSLTHA